RSPLTATIPDRPATRTIVGPVGRVAHDRDGRRHIRARTFALAPPSRPPLSAVRGRHARDPAARPAPATGPGMDLVRLPSAPAPCVGGRPHDAPAPEPSTAAATGPCCLLNRGERRENHVRSSFRDRAPPLGGTGHGPGRHG